ncbi:MAG: hypothetical protein WC291_08940 [Thermodesulfovibrionales bacterium]|jgi:hypothetical protein
MKRVFVFFLFLMTIPSISPAIDIELLKKEPGLILDLSAEAWAKAEKARLMVSVSAATRDEDIVALRAEILKALSSLSNTEWHVTSYGRSQDSAGLTRLEISAETRTDEKILADIYGQAKKLSRAGMQISIADVDYTPDLSEREKALSEARKQVYALAVEEAERSGAALRESYRVWRVDFTQEQQPSFLPKARARAMAVDEAAGAPEMPRGDLIRVRATVILRTGAGQ